jgi:starch synthase
MTEAEESELKTRLRLKWIPWDEGFDPARADDPAFVAGFEASFAEQVNRLTRDPALAARFGKAGRQRCIDEFSWAKIAAETVEVYRRAIELHASR